MAERPPFQLANRIERPAESEMALFEVAIASTSEMNVDGTPSNSAARLVSSSRLGSGGVSSSPVRATACQPLAGFRTYSWIGSNETARNGASGGHRIVAA